MFVPGPSLSTRKLYHLRMLPHNVYPCNVCRYKERGQQTSQESSHQHSGSFGAKVTYSFTELWALVVQQSWGNNRIIKFGSKVPLSFFTQNSVNILILSLKCELFPALCYRSQALAVTSVGNISRQNMRLLTMAEEDQGVTKSEMERDKMVEQILQLS